MAAPCVVDLTPSQQRADHPRIGCYHQLVCLAFFGDERFRAQLEADVDYENQAEGALLPTDLRAGIDELARLYLLGRLGPEDQGFTREWGYPCATSTTAWGQLTSAVIWQTSWSSTRSLMTNREQF